MPSVPPTVPADRMRSARAQRGARATFETVRALCLAVGLHVVATQAALAAGTAANTSITNIATVSYTDEDGQSQTVSSNAATVRVDELLAVTLVGNDAGNVTVATPDDDDPLSFTVTNPGNGSEGYRLTANPNVAGDQYDPADTRIFLDDGDGIFDSIADVLYTAGANDPVLAPDASRVVFVVNDTPAGRVSGDTGIVQLTATAVTGSGAPGTTFPGQGTGGVDAVVGATTATADAQGTYVVSQVQTTLVKSQTVLDPFGGSNPVQDAVVTYTLTMTLSGADALTGARISDAIPADTTYVTGSLQLNGAPLSDGLDGDVGHFTGSEIQVDLGTLAPPSTQIVVFQVRIN